MPATGAGGWRRSAGGDGPVHVTASLVVTWKRRKLSEVARHCTTVLSPPIRPIWSAPSYHSHNAEGGQHRNGRNGAVVCPHVDATFTPRIETQFGTNVGLCGWLGCEPRSGSIRADGFSKPPDHGIPRLVEPQHRRGGVQDPKRHGVAVWQPFHEPSARLQHLLSFAPGDVVPVHHEHDAPRGRQSRWGFRWRWCGGGRANRSTRDQSVRDAHDPGATASCRPSSVAWSLA